MTPKEKANKLVVEYEKKLMYDYSDYHYTYNLGHCKQCALIAVDEMFKEISKWAGGDFQEWEKERWKYLQEVKKEIINL